MLLLLLDMRSQLLKLREALPVGLSRSAPNIGQNQRHDCRDRENCGNCKFLHLMLLSKFQAKSSGLRAPACMLNYSHAPLYRHE
jgi:hypothetical protein